MTTCFYPVAADIRAGDRVAAIEGVRFTEPRTIATSAPGPDSMRHLSFADGTHLSVPSTSTVDLLPPF